MTKMTRRHALGVLRRPAALAATAPVAKAQAAGPELHAAARQRHLQDERRQGPRRLRPRSPPSSRPSGPRACRCCSATPATCFSPSLMSGFDQGAHIVAMLNKSPLDVFVPGNHEFDFGKDELSQAHGRPELSDLRRQSARRRRQAAAGPQGQPDLRARRHQGRRLRHRPRRHAANLQPGDLKFPRPWRRCAREAKA